MATHRSLRKTPNQKNTAGRSLRSKHPKTKTTASSKTTSPHSTPKKPHPAKKSVHRAPRKLPTILPGEKKPIGAMKIPERYPDEPKPKITSHRSIRSIVKYDLSILLSFTILLLGVRLFIISPGLVSGASMVPAIRDGEYFVVNKITYILNFPERFDIVQVLVGDSNARLIKRIVAMPGERVYNQNGTYWVESADGLSYAIQDTLRGAPMIWEKRDLGDNYIEVPLHSYYVVGDNWSVSRDSRVFGPVAREELIGKIIWSGQFYE